MVRVQMVTSGRGQEGQDVREANPAQRGAYFNQPVAVVCKLIRLGEK